MHASFTKLLVILIAAIASADGVIANALAAPAATPTCADVNTACDTKARLFMCCNGMECVNSRCEPLHRPGSPPIPNKS
ncbi:hypothetical protein SCHPADRAFT_904531 [Schizopora paradoxa]|uniref:Uncharacterized protein n=1 Tax=Schizopora paradoxa TaxID=27342 RepID=A0A0H2RMM6_9AGAM|nr:hypothetical protein SCHPADRAFT_904531 [Schizopora paradoxa]